MCCQSVRLDFKKCYTYIHVLHYYECSIYVVDTPFFHPSINEFNFMYWLSVHR
jgi:hypothetical protein